MFVSCLRSGQVSLCSKDCKPRQGPHRDTSLARGSLGAEMRRKGRMEKCQAELQPCSNPLTLPSGGT